MPAPLTTFLLLFRGVGGPVQLPVAQLREALTKAGFKNADELLAAVGRNEAQVAKG